MVAGVISPRIGRTLFISLLLIAFCQASGQKNSALTGKWRGEFTIRDNIKAPFNFEISEEGSVTLINGEERFEAGQISVEGDSVFLPLDQFDNELALHFAGGKLKGALRRQDHAGTPIPLTAEKGNLQRFKAQKPPAQNISGRYEIVFKYQSGKAEKALAIFEQDGSRLTGTFLKPSGDTRFLEGIVDGRRFYLSSFIGSSPGYYEGKIGPRGEIEGFQAGTKIRHSFTGRFNPKAELRDPFSVANTAKGDSTIRFSLPDIEGRTVSLTDEKYKNKVVILAITGTWCPNCIDEAAFLSPWYKKNRDRGVEIITIHFERQADTAFTRKVMSRFRKRFDIEYDQVFGGLAHADSVSAALKGLESFSSFPTTIFIDKKGNVSKIHSGYTGPATGKFYEDFVDEFNAEVDRLLKQ